MFEVNDYVVYNSNGVYKIVDIIKENDVNNIEIEYYALQPVFSNSNLIIKTPVNNPKVLMRGVITKDDVLALISAMPDEETICINDDKKRSENFKDALKTGECVDWIRIIKTLRQDKQEKSAVGKKLMKSEEDIMKTAEKHLHEEFAIALNILPDEVHSFILEHIPT